MEEKGRLVEFATPGEWQRWNGSRGVHDWNSWKSNVFTVTYYSEVNQMIWGWPSGIYVDFMHREVKKNLNVAHLY